MPQFDFMSFFVQIFGMSAFMFSIHLIYLHVFLPKIGTILKFREKVLLKKSQSVSSKYDLWNTIVSYIKR
jgi:hypothetical protein